MFRKSFKSPIPNWPVSIHIHISCVSPVLTMLLQTSGNQSSTESQFLCIAPFSRQPISNCRKICRASPVSFRMGWTVNPSDFFYEKIVHQQSEDDAQFNWEIHKGRSWEEMIRGSLSHARSGVHSREKSHNVWNYPLRTFFPWLKF